LRNGDLKVSIRGLQYSTDREVKQAFAEWLSKYRWTSWGTFTFAKPITNSYLALKKFRAYATALNITGYFIAAEWFHRSVGIHLHGLMLYNGDLTDLWRAWWALYGRNKVDRLHQGDGVFWYCSKYITKDLADWWITYPQANFQGILGLDKLRNI